MKNLYFSTIFLIVTIFFLSSQTKAQWTQVFKPNNYPPMTLVSIDTNVFVGYGGFNGLGGGIYRSTDNGDTWTAVDSGISISNWDTLSIMHLATMGKILIAGSNDDGIFISTNNGDNWDKMNNGIGDSSSQNIHIMAVGANDSTIYTAVTFTAVYVSSDTGKNWKVIDNGLPLNYLGGLAGYNVNAFGFVGTYIYLLFGGCYVSTNGGVNWSISTGDTLTNRGGDCFTSIGNIIFMGDGNTIWRSTDMGKSWVGLSAPHYTKYNEVNISAITSYKSNLIVGSDEGVYVSKDSGATWTALNQGYNYITGEVVYSFTTTDKYLFMATNGLGVLRMPLSQLVTSIDNPKGTLPLGYSLKQNYPNPFNPSTIISYSIPKASFVTIKVYDILGREVATLVEKNEPPGEYSVKFNASNLSSGIYFYQMRGTDPLGKDNNFTSTKKMLLLK